MCRECQISRHVPWNKGIKGLIPWNKGLSLFENKKAYRLHVNKIRREKRKFQTAKEYLSDRIRTLIRNQIKRYGKRNKNTKTELLLGCNANFFREYLENLFTDGMSWNNYGNGEGKWNIDHIIPVSSYDLSTIEEQKKCFHFSNCRPMWSIENIKKRNKIVTW